jgi:hypothetical protein
MRTILSRLRHHGVDLRLYVPHFFRPYGRDVGWPGRHYSCTSLFTCVILAHTRVFQGGFRMRRVCLFLSIGCWATIQAQMPPAGGEENPLRQGRPAAAGAEVLLLPRRGRSTIRLASGQAAKRAARRRLRAGHQTGQQRRKQTDPPAGEWRRRGLSSAPTFRRRSRPSIRSSETKTVGKLLAVFLTVDDR